MYLSTEGLNFLEKVEGSRLKAYKDTAGHLTIGVGHKLTSDELKTGFLVIKGRAYQWKSGLTEDLCIHLLDQDTDYFEKVVTKHVKKPLTQNQFDTLVSFTFNVGAGAFLASTLLRKLNLGDYKAVPVELAKWNKITDPKTKKKVASKGLTNRRLKEINLWNS